MKNILIALTLCIASAGAAKADADTCNPNASAHCACIKACHDAFPPCESRGACNAACAEDPITPPAACAAAPTVAIAVDPTTIWPPNHKIVSVNVSGTVTEPANCTTTGLTCTVTDEYGIFTGAVAVAVSNAFSGVSHVEAWRLGTDMDGRTYTYSCTATNSFGGAASNPAVSLVPHDQR
jgi:hypothetical protein